MITVRAESEKVAEVLIYDVIGADFFGEGVTAAKVKADLDKLGDVSDINVRINSPGGNVWDGIAIFSLLKQHKAQIHVQVDGLAASAASLIAMAGDLITMGEGSMMMIHNPWTLAYGDANAMRKTGEILDKIEGQFVDVYAARTGMKGDDIGALMDAETWFTAAEAVKNGFADEQTKVETTEETAANARSEAWQQCLASFKKTPKAMLESLAAGKLPIAASVQQTSVTPTKETAMETQGSVTQADVTKAAADAAQAAVAMESARRSAIKTAFGRFAAEHRELMDSCLDDVKCTASQASEKLLAKLGEGAAPVGAGSVVAGADARDKMRVGMASAMAVRAGLQKPEGANEFNGRSLCDMAEACLKVAGHSVVGLSKDGIARKVLALHTSSDFPNLLSSTAGKVLRKAYEERPGTWRTWAAVGQVSDFKIHPRIQMGSFSSLATIPEGGEYTYGTINEQYENAQAVTKGKAISFTRQMLVNDDLGGFNRRAMLMGDSAARTVNEDAYTSLLSASGLGPTSTDTGTLINATAVTTAGGHANYTSSGTAISVTSMGVGRVSMASKKAGNLGTGAILNLVPAVLLTSINKEDIARTFMASETDPASSNSKVPNIYRNRYEVVADPLIDAATYTNSWYLFADPNGPAAAMEVVFLDGNETPFIDDEVDFDTDALKFKVRLDYGIAVGDWRGVYRNLGA